MSDPSVFRVRLVKRKQTGFGFIVKQRATPPRLVISELVKNGEAEECGLVKPGDLILGVDGKDVTEMVYETAVELLRSAAVGKPIEMLIRVPKEQKVRLETTYGQDGLPRIVRITEGIVDKISTIVKSPKKQVFNKDGLNDLAAKPLPANNTQSTPTGVTPTTATKTTPSPAKKINQPSSQDINNELRKNSPLPERKNMVTSSPVKNEIPVRKIERPVEDEVVGGGETRQCFGATLQPFNVNQGRRWSATRLVTSSPERPKDLSPEKCSTTTSRSLKSVRLRNMMTGSVAVDTLCKNAIENVQCADKVCLGSLMALPRRAPGTARSKEELLDHAKRFFDEYYTSSKRYNSPAHLERWLEVTKDIEATGTYDLKETELIYGAKLAWRNAVRCIGRIQWTKLQVFDARYVSCTLDMYHAICNHIKYATNKGNIRSTITVFPHRTDPKHDYRVWNPQLISYAGFRQPDGTVIGDPAATDFTDLCIKLGWKPKREKWEILPLLLQANGKDPELYELPEDIVLRVKITHPKYKVFEDMDIEWYALPAVSGMLFDCGGLEFPGAPFNGWYMVTEIGSRDFCDPHRFNMLEPLANGMGFDTSNNSSLWKDKTVTEVNYAVINSFQKANVTIVDHHTLADSFKRHWETEQRVRGGCPADWVWHIPPVSGSLMWIFHQELAYYHLKPSYEYQEGAWKTHVWEKDKDESRPSPRKLRFKDIVKAVKFTSNLFGKALSKRIKATILFATETGHSEDFANILGNIFSYAFNVQVICMADYNISDLEHESLLLVVTSTFGNGDPPEKGESFARALQAIRITGETTPDLSNMSISTSFVRINSMSSEGKRMSKQLTRSSSTSNSEDTGIGPMSSIRYAVFALGSSAYPNFCAFGHFVDSLLGDLGGERISDIGLGDELCGQEHSFREWASSVFQASLDVFCIDDDVNIKEMKDSLKGAVEWAPDKVRIVPSDREVDVYEELSRMSHRDVKPCKLIRSTGLHPTEEHRRTMLFEFSTNYTGFNFVPGDHLAIFPANRVQLVNRLLERLKKMCPDSDCIIEAQSKSYKQTLDGVKTIWTTQERIPPCSLRTALTRYLDITTPPSQKLLSLMVHYAKSEKDKKQLLALSTQMQMYEEWKAHNYPNLLEVLEEFTTVDLDPAFLLINLPTVQARFYSISSSPDAFPNEVHATVAIVTYRTKGGEGPVHYGVCSNYLASLNVGEPAPCFIRSDPSFSLPDNPSVPVIMVGPGTGIAPFRGFWQQRAFDMKKLKYDGVQFGPMLLYFGCRTSTVELHRDEIEIMMQEGVITKHYVAFSRQSNKPKCYVQDIMWEQTSQSLYNYIVTNNGHFYVCGDVTMADCVSKTLIEIFQKHGNLSITDAERYLYTMKEQNRFHDDIFGITLRTAEKTRKVRIQAQQKHNENTSSMDN